MYVLAHFNLTQSLKDSLGQADNPRDGRGRDKEVGGIETSPNRQTNHYILRVTLD